MSIVRNSMHYDRTKHLDIDRHFIFEKIENKLAMLHIFLLNNGLLIFSVKLFLMLYLNVIQDGKFVHIQLSGSIGIHGEKS